eukprot:CAMPEP_0170462838 /NCGR_PEP_ID=MMETSP0123-20130129/8182_1 /TAXON_ID=182087 /ORGANISM="Favella ehrenbergii, Strain Fehren 1" /LENGTH=60 /DNA_ID=CAMNT_0010728135 /DNA_START=258 /DNA_END=440 /DNA_ORIENTATION=-
MAYDDFDTRYGANDHLVYVGGPNQRIHGKAPSQKQVGQPMSRAHDFYEDMRAQNRKVPVQ